MKKLRKLLYVKFRPVILYRDNFYKIYKIFNKECKQITIIADNMKSEEKEGIDDFIDAVLKEESTDISNLDIQGDSPDISLTLTKYSTELYAKNDLAKDKEIFEELREILKHKQISNFNIKRNAGFFMYLAIFTIPIFMYADTDIVNKTLYTSLISIIVFFIIGYAVGSLFIMIKNKHKVLHLKKEYKDTKLLNKCKKNTAICMIIASIVIPILVAIFPYLTVR